ncbi:unnamed protein product [Phytophthora fragariaefolia]|uniref:Unnamed protein product n=1 Tax=Phytophthora fragariaefolia TaxID=1490495 RepID=A0A9W6Y455_9STRA|nr:unnamed protein product [Phytophthora fragariaefolia]
MSSSSKREREWEASASGGASAGPAADSDPKRPRISSPSSPLSPHVLCTSTRRVSAAGERADAHPMAVLDAIRAKLQSASDPHLQARLLLQYSAAAASPGAQTAAAIDFLFSFLQQNQTQAEAAGDGTQPGKDVGSSGAIVVGAIVRGLRRLLAVKPAVVEPMIQVDAMGEQLMQCMSVGEDFKLRRDMLRIVVDCLMLSSKFQQVEALLRVCVRDHDAGMQAICLRGYLRLHDAGRCFAAESPDATDAVADHFDRFAAFVLFAQSEEVRVLAAQALVALADLHPQHQVASSRFFPSSMTMAAMKTTLFLPEKAFYVLCMAGSDAADLVRVEVARCLRGFSRVLVSGVVEHAVLKSQIDEAVVDVTPEILEMNTRRMMSSGVLLSLLEDDNEDVAAEASRTMSRLGELGTTPEAGVGRWSQRALERVITAHFDALPRASTSNTSQLCRVLVNSLSRLLMCRNSLDTKTDFTISNADLSCLVRSATSDADAIKPAIVEILTVLQNCDVSSIWAVQRIVDFVFDSVTSSSFDFSSPHSDNEGDHDADCWNKRILAALRDLGSKCSKVLQADVALSDRIRQEASSQRSDQRRFLKRVCEALLGHKEFLPGDILKDSNKPPSNEPNLFFLKTPPSNGRQLSCSNFISMPSQVANSLDTLRKSPVDGNIAIYLKADLDVSVRAADVIVRLRQHVHSFPDASSAPAPTAHKYVSMQAMLSTSPCVGSGHTSNTSVGSRSQNEAQAFASLRLSVDLEKGCQEMVGMASDTYVKAFALSASPRTELLQLILLGRVGLVLALLQNSSDSLLRIEKLRWISKEATRLRVLISDNQHQGEMWLPTQLLSDVSSLDDLKRVFVAIVRQAWPSALVEAAIARSTRSANGSGVLFRRPAIAHASILEPITIASAKSEPREITANWPFEQRVRFLLKNVRDTTRVYIGSLLPNGDAEYHRVPASSICFQGPRKHLVDYTIALTVPPFSDPTAYAVAVCLGHATLPGSVKVISYVVQYSSGMID